MKAYCYGITLLMIILAGCTDMGSEPVITTAAGLDASIDGKTVEVGQNQRFSLELDLNADGGYQWDYQISDTNVVRMESTSYRPKSGQWGMVGGLTVETFQFRTGRTGTSAIHLIEHRGWEPDIPPINTVEFIVLVK